MDSAWIVAFAWLCALARDTGRHLNFYKFAASVQRRKNVYLQPRASMPVRTNTGLRSSDLV